MDSKPIRMRRSFKNGERINAKALRIPQRREEETTGRSSDFGRTFWKAESAVLATGFGGRWVATRPLSTCNAHTCTIIEVSGKRERIDR
jgi:hypothetical protein